MLEAGRHPNINLLAYSEVKSVTGKAGNFTVKVLKKARFVDEKECTSCGKCVEKCPKKVPNEFELGLDKRKAIYLYFPQGIPAVVTIDTENCIYFATGKCKVCEKYFIPLVELEHLKDKIKSFEEIELPEEVLEVCPRCRRRILANKAKEFIGG